MRHESSQSQKGFSLIELLIYIALFGVVLTSIYRMLESNRATYASGEGKIEVQTNARVAIDEITRQLRVAGYYPENFDPDPLNDLVNPRAIHVATDNALAVFGDADGSAVSNVFFFCLDGTNLRRHKDVVGAPAYTCSNGEIVAESVTSLRFSYFDANGATVPGTPTPPYRLDSQNVGAVPSFSSVVERGAVRRVVVALTVTETVPRQATQIYTLTSDVRLRNIN